MLKRLFALGVMFVIIIATTTAQTMEDGKILVWAADGPGPEGVSASQSGQLGWMDNTGNITPITLAVPQGTSRVMSCGTSQDGSRVYFYVGQDDGTLYALSKSDITPVVLDTVRSLTCLSGGSFQTSPDGARLAYIDYEPIDPADEFSDGRLRLVATSDLSRANVRENDVIDTAAFDITDDLIAFIRLPETGARNEALEAVVNTYNGTSVQPIAVLRPDAEGACRFTSASIEILPNGQFVALMGHRCRSGSNTNTTWRVFTIDPSTRDSFTQIASGTQDGAFFPFTRTNNVIVAQNGGSAVVTLPDGLVASSASVQVLDFASGSVTPVLGRGGWFARTADRQYLLDESAYPILSHDGRWYAFVEKNPNNDQVLHVVDLSNMTVKSYPAPNRGDVIAHAVFTPDSGTIVYTQGGSASKENVLFTLNLETGAQVSVLRGRFGYLALSPSGNQVAVMEWQTVEDVTQPPYQSFAVVDISTSGYIPLWNKGAVITPEGKVTETKFVYPLAWLPN